MRIPGLKTAKTFYRQVRARVLGGALILGYHRVENTWQDPYGICISPEHFAEHMEVISRNAHPINLTSLVDHWKRGSLPNRAVAVTFDDGYADNLYQAKPILEKYEVPAIAFICTGYLGKEFWWDELYRLVMSSQAYMHTLFLQVREDQFNWDQSVVDPESENPEARRQFCHALYLFLLSLDIEEQDKAMNKIRIWADVPSDDTPTARAMTQAELTQLADGGLIEPGSHTHSHSMLPRLSSERQKTEIISSKQDLEELLNIRISGFAYPNGGITMEAKSILQDQGFQYACRSELDLFRHGCDAYSLPRFWPKNFDGDGLIQYLRKWITLEIS